MSSSTFLMQYANSNAVNELGKTFTAATSYRDGITNPITTRKISTRASRDVTINNANREIARLMGIISHLSGNIPSATSTANRAIEQLKLCNIELVTMQSEVTHDRREVMRLNDILKRIQTALKMTSNVLSDALFNYVNKQTEELGSIHNAKQTLDATAETYISDINMLQHTYDVKIAEWTKSNVDLIALTEKHEVLGDQFEEFKVSTHKLAQTAEDAKQVLNTELAQLTDAINNCTSTDENTSLRNQIKVLESAKEQLTTHNEVLKKSNEHLLNENQQRQYELNEQSNSMNTITLEHTNTLRSLTDEHVKNVDALSVKVTALENGRADISPAKLRLLQTSLKKQEDTHAEDVTKHKEVIRLHVIQVDILQHKIELARSQNDSEIDAMTRSEALCRKMRAKERVVTAKQIENLTTSNTQLSANIKSLKSTIMLDK